MLRVDSDGALIIDGEDYNSVDVMSLRANEDITLHVISGYVHVNWPLDSEYYEGATVVFRVGQGDYLRITNYAEGASKVMLTYDAEVPEEVDLYNQPSIVPAAVSSELDNHGEERIHIAPYEDVEVPVPPTPPVCISAHATTADEYLSLDGVLGLPIGDNIYVGSPLNWGESYYDEYGDIAEITNMSYEVLGVAGEYPNVQLTDANGAYVGCINLTVTGAA